MATQPDAPKTQQTIGIKRSAGKRSSLSTPAAKRSRHSATAVVVASPAEPSPAASTPAAASPVPTPKLARLPTKVHEHRQLPTRPERQVLQLPDSDYQSIAVSAVLSTALERSKLRWINSGILDRYWVKPETGKHAKPPPKNNPEVKWMKSKGPCRIRVEPHVFEVDIYVEEKVKPQPPPKQYAPPAAQSPYGQPYRAQQQTPQQFPPRHLQNASTPSSRAGTPGVSPANRSTPPVQSRQTPVPLNQQQRKPIASAPPVDVKPAQDPVITMLAARASSDAELKGLMKEVATGNATPEQLKIFQRHIDELTAIIQKQRRDEEARQTWRANAPGNQKPGHRQPVGGGPASKAGTPARPQNIPPTQTQTPAARPPSLQQTPAHTATPPAQIKSEVPAPAAAPGQQTGNSSLAQVPPQPLANVPPQPSVQTQQPQGTPRPQQQVQSIQGSPAPQQLPQQLPPQAPSQQQPPKAQPQTPYNYQTPQPPRATYQKPWVPPPPASLPVIIAFTTAGATEDRFLFPQHSVLESLTPQHMLASFLVTKKSRLPPPTALSPDSITPTPDDNEPPSPAAAKEIEYYQPITLMVEVAYGREEILNCIRRWVKPVDAVCAHMEATMARCTRAPTDFLALRLPFRGTDAALSSVEEDRLNAAAVREAAMLEEAAVVGKVKKERKPAVARPKKKDAVVITAGVSGVVVGGPPGTAVGGAAAAAAAAPASTGDSAAKSAPATAAMSATEKAPAVAVAEGAPTTTAANSAAAAVPGPTPPAPVEAPDVSSSTLDPIKQQPIPSDTAPSNPKPTTTPAAAVVVPKAEEVNTPAAPGAS